MSSCIQGGASCAKRCSSVFPQRLTRGVLLSDSWRVTSVRTLNSQGRTNTAWTLSKCHSSSPGFLQVTLAAEVETPDREQNVHLIVLTFQASVFLSTALQAFGCLARMRNQTNSEIFENLLRRSLLNNLKNDVCPSALIMYRVSVHAASLASQKIIGNSA